MIKSTRSRGTAHRSLGVSSQLDGLGIFSTYAVEMFHHEQKKNTHAMNEPMALNSVDGLGPTTPSTVGSPAPIIFAPSGSHNWSIPAGISTDIAV